MSGTIPFADALWPDDGPVRTYLPLSRHGILRSLLPADSSRQLRGSLARSNGPESRSRHLARGGLALGADLRRRVVGTRGLVPLPGRGLELLLAEAVGTDVRLAFHFGPPRANRKPVIHAFDATGTLVAIAKLGVDDLTAALVRTEAATLEELAAQTGCTLVVPPLLSLTTWGEHPLLVQGALPVPRRHVVPPAALLDAAARDVAALSPSTQPRVSQYAADLRRRLEQLPATAPVERYLATLDLVAETIDLDQWSSAAWHGDWSPQNVATTSDARQVAAWDWERFAHGRPPGFDTAHFRLQQLLGDRGTTQPGVSLIHEAPALLDGWQGRTQPERARGASALLLLELAARYLGDGQVGTGSPGSRVVSWTEPAMREYERLRGSSRGTLR